MLATLARTLAVVAEVAAVAVLIAKARQWESIADLRERVAALEALIHPDPDEDTPPCSTDSTASASCSSPASS